MRVTINGVENEVRTDSLTKFTDLVEVIKSNIDPDHMITDLLLDGNELTDADWTSPLSIFENRELSVFTGTPDEYVHSRFELAAPILRSCYMEFRSARKDFQNGKTQSGNTRLCSATKNLQAFFQWYGTIVEILAPEERQQYNIDPQVHDVATICKKICQQQMYQSWWQVADTIKNELEPKIDELEDICRTYEA